MRKILLLFIFIISFTSIKAQYQSIFGKDSTKWVFNSDFPLVGYAVGNAVHFKDTIINSTKNRIIKFSSRYKNTCPSIDCDTAYAWEDTVQGKVWISYNNVDTFLVMDLSLNVGDTFKIIEIGGNINAVVDSVYFINNKKYVRTKYNDVYYPQSKFTMIEGIGTTYGIMLGKGYLVNIQSPLLLCLYKDAYKAYSSTDPIHDGNCDLVRTNIDEVSLSNQIKMYPNPANDIIQIESANNDIVIDNIQIHNAQGQLVKIYTNIRNINVQDLPNGIYLLQMNTNYGLITKRLVVE